LAKRVFEIVFAVPKRTAPSLAERLLSAGAGAIEERGAKRGRLLVVYAEGEREAKRLSELGRALATETTSRPLSDDWRTGWMAYLAPEAITDQIVLCPIGQEASLGREHRRLLFEPDMVFGVGSHPTTRLCARAVERHCLAHPGLDVLDVGTGSGVLAMVAASCGAARVLGLEVDPVAVRSARHNARLNRLEGRCTFSLRPLERLGRRFDLVVANIEAWVLLELARPLAAALGPGATLLVSGLLSGRAPELLGRFAEFGLSLRGRDRQKGWELLELCSGPEHPLTWASPGRLGRKTPRR